MTDILRFFVVHREKKAMCLVKRKNLKKANISFSCNGSCNGWTCIM